MPVLWFCVELPALGLEVCARRMLDEDIPAVLVQDNRVVACNSAALVCGIVNGSSLATAHSLSHRLVHFSRDIDAERERLRFLADAAYRFSGSVSIQEPSAILLEVSGSLRLFGGIYGLKRSLISLLGEFGHQTAVGIAHTPLAALALARAGENCELPRFPAAQDVKSLILKTLRRIPLCHTECDRDTIERFSNMGLETLGEVLRLPTAELGRRFGPKLLDYLERLSGQQPDPRICITPAAFFTSELGFLESISNKEALAFPMQRLAQDLGHWLVARQLGVMRIQWRFAPFNAAAATMEVEFAEPQQSKQTLLSISRLKLETMDLPEEVLSLRLASVRLTPWQAASHLLFAKTEQAGAHSPTELIDQFKARLGDGVCCGISVDDDHRPEFAWSPTAPNMVSKGRRDQLAPARRPPWLLATPKPAQRRQLKLLRGPERIDVGWWTATGSCALVPGSLGQRDYFIARHVDGSQCWVFSDQNGDWFIHGYFA